MSKYKSEVLTIKINLMIKFSQVAITKIRTLPPLFPKMFRTAVWWKTRDSCYWHYLRKTINLGSRKVVLIVFTEMCSAYFFMEIKMLLQSKKFNVNWQKILFQEVCASWKQMLGIDKKSSFLSKNINLQRLFNNYFTHRDWEGLSVFRDVAWRKTRGWVVLHERP